MRGVSTSECQQHAASTAIQSLRPACEVLPDASALFLCSSPFKPVKRCESSRKKISTNQSKVQALSQSNPPNSTKARCGLSVPSSLHLAMLKFHWPSQKHATRRFNESFINLVNHLVRKGTRLRGSSASSRFQRTLEHSKS